MRQLHCTSVNETAILSLQTFKTIDNSRYKNNATNNEMARPCQTKIRQYTDQMCRQSTGRAWTKFA